MDGHFYSESLKVAVLIESEFQQDFPLLPSVGTPERKEALGLLDLADNHFFCVWEEWLTDESCDPEFEQVFISVSFLHSP